MKLDKGQLVMASILLLVVLLLFLGRKNVETHDPRAGSAVDAATDSSDHMSGVDAAADPTDYKSTHPSSVVPTLPDRVDKSLLPRERAQWKSDPDSKGWSDEDRRFFEEHGVSESEARAMETILREQGVN